jgi:hypothetical protein
MQSLLPWPAANVPAAQDEAALLDVAPRVGSAVPAATGMQENEFSDL